MNKCNQYSLVADTHLSQLTAKLTKVLLASLTEKQDIKQAIT